MGFFTLILILYPIVLNFRYMFKQKNPKAFTLYPDLLIERERPVDPGSFGLRGFRYALSMQIYFA